MSHVGSRYMEFWADRLLVYLGIWPFAPWTIAPRPIAPRRIAPLENSPLESTSVKNKVTTIWTGVFTQTFIVKSKHKYRLFCINQNVLRIPLPYQLVLPPFSQSMTRMHHTRKKKISDLSPASQINFTKVEIYHLPNSPAFS